MRMRIAVMFMAVTLLCSACSLLPKANQIKGLQVASASIAAVQALDCEAIKGAVATVKPEAAAVDCPALKLSLDAAQALVQAQIAQLQK